MPAFYCIVNLSWRGNAGGCCMGVVVSLRVNPGIGKHWIRIHKLEITKVIFTQI